MSTKVRERWVCAASGKIRIRKDIATSVRRIMKPPSGRRIANALTIYDFLIGDGHPKGTELLTVTLLYSNSGLKFASN